MASQNENSPDGYTQYALFDEEIVPLPLHEFSGETSEPSGATAFPGSDDRSPEPLDLTPELEARIDALVDTGLFNYSEACDRVLGDLAGRDSSHQIGAAALNEGVSEPPSAMVKKNPNPKSGFDVHAWRNQPVEQQKINSEGIRKARLAFPRARQGSKDK